MGNVLSDIFEETMGREHHTATVFTSGEEFDCFFRRNADSMNERDSMVMYYRINAPVKAGSLICYGGYNYLALNRETVENNVYYKSSIVRTNGTITTHSLSVTGLPFYSDSISNATSTNSTYISIIDGNAEILTEDNEMSRELSVNDLLNEWGRTWKITNLFYVDGVCHIIVEVNADIEPTYTYSVGLSSLASLNVAQGDTDAIIATAYINDVETTGATFEYSSSDTDIATIDENGNIEYIADGEVSFTATWVEQDVSASTSIVTVQSEAESDEVTIYIDTFEEVYNTEETEFICYGLTGGVRDDSIAVSVAAENISGVTNQTAYLKYITITNLGDGKYQILVDSSNMLGKTFELVATAEGYDVEVRQTVTVRSFW